MNSLNNPHIKARLASLAQELTLDSTENKGNESGAGVIDHGDEKTAPRDIYAKIVEKVCSALRIESGALLLSKGEARQFLTAYTKLPPELLQIISTSEHWLGLTEHVERMTPDLLSIKEGPQQVSYRTAMLLFGFKSLALVPFRVSSTQVALLLLPVKAPLSSEEEHTLRGALALCQTHIQLAMDHVALKLRDAQHKARLVAVKEGLSELASTSHPLELLQTTCEQIHQVFRCTVAWIGLTELDGEERKLEPTVVHGGPDCLLSAMSAKVQGDSADIFSSAAVNQMTTSAHTFFGDASREAAKDPSDPLHHLIYPDAFATTMTVPLQSLDERLGSLVLHKDAAFKLVDEDEEVLRVFADQAAIAIKSARLLRKGEQREARLEASQGQYRSFVKQLSDGIFRLDKSGNVMELSDCAADLFGVAAEELISLPLKRSFAASDHPQLEKSINLALEGNGQELILKVQRPDNRQMIVIVRIGPLLAGGNVVGLIGVARDDTARIAMQSKLLVREKLASVGMLAAGVAHEINNPLSFIISNLVTLTEDRELETGDFDHQEQLEMLRECLEGTDRIKNIVSNLKQFSQLGSHEEFFTVDLNPIIESTTWMVYPEARYHGRINLELTPIPSIHCSPGRIAQLFVQLMLNGIEALPQGDPEDQFINVKTKHEGDCIILEIADSGKGISRQALPLIIEPYYTTKGPEHGTGLGLVMCREVVQRHRGQMCIQTKEGEGTTVRIALPINPLKTDGLTPTVVLKYADEILAD